MPDDAALLDARATVSTLQSALDRAHQQVRELWSRLEHANRELSKTPPVLRTPRSVALNSSVRVTRREPQAMRGGERKAIRRATAVGRITLA